jgi:hypothetical protein
LPLHRSGIACVWQSCKHQGSIRDPANTPEIHFYRRQACKRRVLPLRGIPASALGVAMFIFTLIIHIYISIVDTVPRALHGVALRKFSAQNAAASARRPVVGIIVSLARLTPFPSL